MFQLAGGKGNFDKYWPLKDQDNEPDKFAPISKEWWNKIKNNQAKIDKQIQNVRSNENRGSGGR